MLNTLHVAQEIALDGLKYSCNNQDQSQNGTIFCLPLIV